MKNKKYTKKYAWRSETDAPRPEVTRLVTQNQRLHRENNTLRTQRTALWGVVILSLVLWGVAIFACNK